MSTEALVKDAEREQPADVSSVGECAQSGALVGGARGRGRAGLAGSRRPRATTAESAE